MKTLIIKFGASGDVVRTTTVLHLLQGEVDWITSDLNASLLNGISKITRVITQSEIDSTVWNNYD